jgi:hypothetical protein
MGHLLGRDCAEVDAERSALCVVDALVLPLLAVAYLPQERPLVLPADFARRLAELRQACPRAFSQSVNSLHGSSLFEHVFTHLTQPYAWTDSARRQQVLEYANGLFFMLFGVVQDRGIESVERYLEHSGCAVYIARALLEHEAGFAEQELRDGVRFYQNSRTDAPLQSEQPPLPGASLYLIDRRLPVSINLRWMLQCVVLAKDAGDGGAMASFLADLNSGRLSASRDVVDCANYRHDDKDTAPLALSAWLRRAKFLFTQTPSAELHPLQITTDVYASISRAVAQLPVLAMPDLTCVTAKEGWVEAQGAEGKTVFERADALLHLHRFRNPALGFEVGAANTGIGSTQRIFEDAGSSSVYEQVLQFLVKGTAKEGTAWSAQFAVTLGELEAAKVLENMHIFANVVAPKDMYPRFEYTNLANLPQFYEKISAASPTLETYTASDAQQLCACTEAQRNKLISLCYNRLRLRKPE